MPYAQYDMSNGFISVANNLRADDGMLCEGRAQIEVLEGVNGSNSRINLETMEVEALPPQEVLENQEEE